MTPLQDPKKKKFHSTTNAHSLKAAIFHTMASKLSLEINNDKITESTKRSILKVLYIVCKIKKKQINFEHYARIHLAQKSQYVKPYHIRFSSYSSFTTKDDHLCVALDEACSAFKAMMLDFEYSQKFELNDPQTHQIHPPQHPFC